MTNEQVTAIVSIIGSLTVLTPLLSLLIAWLTYKRKVKKEEAEKAQSEGRMIAKLDNMNEKLDRLEKHDEAEITARQEMAVSLARLETKVDSHINNKSIHVYKTIVASKKGGHK